jgi:hypothetical protein
MRPNFGRTERSQSVQVGELVKVETEEVGRILILDRLVHQMPEARFSEAQFSERILPEIFNIIRHFLLTTPV